jgi:mono/diheme cytochrome c family protein
MAKKICSVSITIVTALIVIAAAASFFGNAARANSPAGDAAGTYNSKCAKCHGRDGRSKTTRGRLTHSRDLTSGEWQNDVSDERIYNSISNGKGKMPAFKKSLTDSQIDELVNYVRRLRK